MPVLEGPTMEEEQRTDAAQENRPPLVKGHGHAAWPPPFEAAQPIGTRYLHYDSVALHYAWR
jgi:hypothetical protein